MSTKLSGSVGRRGVNAAPDVMLVQKLLGQHVRWLSPLRAPPPSGQCDTATLLCIEEFQARVAVLARPDGVISPSGYTFKALNRPAVPELRHPIFDSRNWKHEPGALTAEDYAAAAKELGCEAAAIEAVARTETKTSPWDKEGRPTILFERHKFSHHSKRAFDRSHPDLSSPKQYNNKSTNKGDHYGSFALQYVKLRRAAMLHEQAALKAASWGAFQILGENHVASGFGSVDDFVSAMMRSERDHLDAFVSFIKSSSVLLKAIREKDWTTFASRYNGPGYKTNDYDTKMKNWYEKLTAPKVKPGGAKTGGKGLGATPISY
jgi:hypothetical protein